MITTEIIQKLKERYSSMHPLLFARSVERAKSDVELFDILESMPQIHPIKWDETERRFMSCKLFEDVDF